MTLAAVPGNDATGIYHRSRRRHVIETPLTLPPGAKCAAESTFQAVAYVLRQHGMRRLNDPWLTTRLGEFSDAQIGDLIAALGRMKPRYPEITDQLISEIAKLGGSHEL
jgi:hypothetical protein